MIACRDLLQKPSQNHAPDLLGGPKAIALHLLFLRRRAVSRRQSQRTKTSGARSLPNISPGSAIKRFRVVATRMGIHVAPSTDCAFGTRTPCSGRPAHAQHRSASARPAATEK